jgi:hypothetical protein
VRGRKEVIEQFHSDPDVPIVPVGAYVRELLELFITAKFLAMLVFVGLSNSSKKAAHLKVPECKEKLRKIY